MPNDSCKSEPLVQIENDANKALSTKGVLLSDILNGLVLEQEMINYTRETQKALDRIRDGLDRVRDGMLAPPAGDMPTVDPGEDTTIGCSGCEQPCDWSTCWCGDDYATHSPPEVNGCRGFVPMGCTCFYAKPPEPPEPPPVDPLSLIDHEWDL